jgi:hypothetical protein
MKNFFFAIGLFLITPTALFAQWATNNTLPGTNNTTGGNCGIGVTSPSAPLQFNNTAVNKKIVLWDVTNVFSNHNYIGLGANTSIFRYQVDNTSSSHVFYAATGPNSSTSNELLRIQGNGNVGIGTTTPTSLLHLKGGKMFLDLNWMGSGTATSGINFGNTGTSTMEINYEVFAGCVGSGRLKIGPVGTTNKAIYLRDNSIIFSNNMSFGAGSCGQPGLSGTYLFDAQVSSTSLLVATPVSSPPNTYPSIPSGYMFSVQGNSHIGGNLGIGTTTIPSGFVFSAQGSSHFGGNVGIGTTTIPSGYVAGIVGNASLNGRIQINNSTSTAPNNSQAGLNISNTSTYSWIQTEDSKPLALNPQATTTNNNYVAIGFDPSNPAITVPSGYKLAIDGKVICTELKVKSSSYWPDYVFDPKYKLMPLDSVSDYISENKHLPEVPSAQEIEENGINTGEINTILLKKIEELTLYMIEQKKEMDLLKEKNLLLEQKMENIIK